jgi:UDP-glucose 4-epimerase
MNILITGISGFVGLNLYKKIQGNITAIGRNSIGVIEIPFFLKTIGPDTDYSDCLMNQHVVIHCAARTHIMHEPSLDPLTEFRQVNCFGTLNLARQAAEAGVKRFIFISSIKVNGETTTGLKPYLPEDKVNPQDAYGTSKAEAEEGLLKISQETGMEVVIIRPPLVYGPGVKANFLNLIKLARTALPLPFGDVRNRRSMIYVGNLVDFIVRSIDHPRAANQIFLIADGQDLSLTALLVLLRRAMGKSARLVPIPILIFKWAGYVFRKQELIDRLVGSLQVDSKKAEELLDWKPPYTVEQGIQITVNDFIKSDK